VSVPDTRPRSARLPRQVRRAQLLDAALEVFVAQGYHAAALDEIAERAGVTKPVLYRHFPGKLDLYLALLQQAADRIIGATREALASTPDNKQRVAATVRVFYAYVSDAAGAFRLVFESDLTSEPAVRALVDRVTDSCAAEITEVISADTGLSAEESRLLAVALVGMAQVSARFWLDGRGELTEGEAASLISSLAWRGISRFPLAEERAASDQAPD
jgi:AcrR family transcriptional regulator